MYGMQDLQACMMRNPVLVRLLAVQTRRRHAVVLGGHCRHISKASLPFFFDSDGYICLIWLPSLIHDNIHLAEDAKAVQRDGC
jgi:hypothetical protein